MPQAFNIPAAWRGKELLNRDDWQLVFDESAVAELDAALESAHGLKLEDISAANFKLPSLSEKLLAIQHSLEHGSGAVMLRGLPIERYGEEQAARLFWGLTSHIGTAVSQSPAGERIFHVRDEGYSENDPKARGPSSRKKLSYHTDRCDVISFLCVRQAASGGENYLVSSVAIYNAMLQQRPDLVEVLMQPYRYQRHNVDTGNELPYYEQPIFSIHEGHFAANLLRVLIERAYSVPGATPMSDLQREALDYIEQLADDPSLHVSFRQQAGDVVFLNNWVTLHRRSEFVDHTNPDRKRLLLRIWLSVPNSRPLDPRFAGSYGTTQAGAIRGGMRPA
ncbi:MAG: TauD/TfdA family dioxygenase [Planctomycetaceae bacterium]|nr:TauD/TfdA family dioxygenase [Planctomycetales bacterium]MCB9874467.1 TauD/TfdA family dioxygenase [Planctomycetaceae bacterium]MCB9940956.1 TauD/TfdA family dioxygenase [Planctomycetaceae bacterium]HRX79488.1 TauD/TfdA family dioxygenase [Pirellulaceae bacterium]